MICNCRYCNGDVDAHLEAEYEKYEVRISHIKTATPEELMQNERVKGLVEALRNIKSTSKKDLTENPAYWGEMIVGEAMQALKKFEVSK